jgi:hypothetical protein
LRNNTNCEDDHDNKTASTITLAFPWLESLDTRLALYGPNWHDATPLNQESYIGMWLSELAALPLEAAIKHSGIAMQWYPTRYHATLLSIFAMGNLCELIPPTLRSQNMIYILEEPKHVNSQENSTGNRTSFEAKYSSIIMVVDFDYQVLNVLNVRKLFLQYCVD